NLPPNVTVADFAGCGPLLAGPEQRRDCTQSTELDPAAIDRGQSFTVGPGITSPAGIASNVMIIHLKGARAAGFPQPLLCRAGDPPLRVGPLTLPPLAPNAVPTLGNDGFPAFVPALQAMYDGDGVAIPSTRLGVASGPASPRVVVRASPDVSDVTGFR